MIAASVLSLQGIVDRSQEGSKRHRTMFRHLAVRRCQWCLVKGGVIGDSTGRWGMGSEERNIWAFQCLEAVARSTAPLPTSYAHDLNCSSAEPSASHSQMIPPSPREIQGMQTGQLYGVCVPVGVVSLMVVVEHQLFEEAAPRVKVVPAVHSVAP